MGKKTSLRKEDNSIKTGYLMIMIACFYRSFIRILPGSRSEENNTIPQKMRQMNTTMCRCLTPPRYGPGLILFDISKQRRHGNVIFVGTCLRDNLNPIKM